MKKETELSFKFSPDLLIIRRKLLNYSQTKIGQLLGVTKMTISKWETGHHAPPARQLEKLAKILETKPERMLLLDFEERKTKLNAK